MTEKNVAARILLVIADDATREGYATALGAIGHKVIVAADGTADVSKLRVAKVDLILFDIEAPGGNGLPHFVSVRAGYPQVPFIVVTDHESLDVAIVALRSGAADLLLKPVTPEQICLTVGRALEHSRLSAANACLLEQLDSERSKSEFVAIASHEIRTPLTTIKNCHGILRAGTAGPLTQDQEHLLLLAEQSLNRLTLLAENLSDVARLEEGQLTFLPESFDLGSLLEEIIKESEPLSAQKQLATVVNWPPEGVRVFADRGRLGQVFRNLLHNAIEFSNAGAHIWIDVRICSLDDIPLERRGRLGDDPGPLVEVEITDEGGGIPLGEEERIFERFVQGSASLQRVHGGIGLGLPIARGLLERHGGTLWGTRLPEGGSRFYAVLPQGPIGDGSGI